MSPGRKAISRASAIRAILALIALSACFGAAAYAATRPTHPAPALGGSKPVEVAPQQGSDGPRNKKDEPLLQPRFIEYPEAVSAETETQFRFHVPSRRAAQPGPPQPGAAAPTQPRPFQCRLDGSRWTACESPHRLDRLSPGGHTFAVRALNRGDLPGPVISYSWQRVEPETRDGGVDRNDEVGPSVEVDPKPFSVELGGQLEELHPGDPAQELPVLITNPNAVPIEVTSLAVAIAGEPPECGAENFSLSPSSASAATPITVPANDSVSLPTATVAAPTIAMLNLPVNQDSCRGVDIPLAFAGEAGG